MSWASDDLAQIMVAPDREHVGFAEGIIRSWDPETFRSTIAVRGSDLHDLPVASGVEALTYQPGDVVLLSRWKPRSGRGSATYRIGMGGRVIVPGSDAAERAIAFMQTSLAGALSAQIFADRVDSDTVTATEGTGSTSFTDLDTVGPQVTLNVSEARKAIVWLSSRMDVVNDVNLVDTKNVSVEVSGASSIPPVFVNSLTLHHANNNTEFSSLIRVRASVQVTLTADDGLNAGTNTFTAKYRTGETTFPFSERTITVMAL